MRSIRIQSLSVVHCATRLLNLSLTSAIGLSLLLIVALPTLLAPWLAPYDPNALTVGPRLAGPSLDHPFGTDGLGRDQLARVLYGGRVALGVASLVLAISVAVGTLVGSIAGYLGGRTDEIISFLLNIVLTLPGLSLTLALVAFIGPGAGSLILALTATAWAGYARLFRGAVLATRQQLFVEAARSYGATNGRIILRHIVPNVARPILALASLNLSSVMLALAGLSYLGIGVQPPTADWGTMLSDARPYLRSAPHLAIPPALCIIAVALGATLLADGLLADDRREIQ